MAKTMRGSSSKQYKLKDETYKQAESSQNLDDLSYSLNQNDKNEELMNE